MARKSHYGQHRMTVLGLIHQASLRHAAPPSVRELAEHTGVGVATVHLYLKRLAEEGLIEWRPGRHRSLHCSPQGTLLASSQAP